MHLAICILGSSICICGLIVHFCCCCCLKIIHCINLPPFIYLFTDKITTWLLLTFGNYEQSCFKYFCAHLQIHLCKHQRATMTFKNLPSLCFWEGNGGRGIPSSNWVLLLQWLLLTSFYEINECIHIKHSKKCMANSNTQWRSVISSSSLSKSSPLLGSRPCARGFMHFISSFQRTRQVRTSFSWFICAYLVLRQVK